MVTKQISCKLCGKTFICDNGMWFTTCDCARTRPAELKTAQDKYDRDCLMTAAAGKGADHE